jgi:acetoin utilization protein AcuC
MLPVMPADTLLYTGPALAAYGFPAGHPLGADRQGAFLAEAARLGLDHRVRSGLPRRASRAEIERFHQSSHYDWVQACCARGDGYFDDGDTPVFPQALEAASSVVGAALDALEHIMRGDAVRSFQPIGGLHHARRGRAAGFCIFNDIGCVIDTLRAQYGVRRIAYVDIDVHHGDGVYYPYEHDRDVVIADIHEDGRVLYPGSGHAAEIGLGAAAGSKLNIALAPGADDAAFFAVWDRALAHIAASRPEIVLLQCGADGMAGDPLADLRFTTAPYRRVARDLRQLADRHCGGRLMAFGGGGYALANLAAAWTTVLEALAD